MWRKLLLLSSQGLNVVLFDGDPEESLSARAFREHDRSAAWDNRKRLIDRWFGRGHCWKAYLAWRERERARQ